MAQAAPELDIEVRLILEAIYERYHYDFRDYAGTSLRRRLKAAMQRFHCANLSQLQGRLLREAEVFRSVLADLTVQVSEMFRDPEYFRALREQVVPVLRTFPSLRIWVAGCSGGEEAYSMAILMKEEGLLERTLVIWMGEFGRTPRINGGAGRDHWAPLSTLALAGGGLRMGQVVGQSSEKAEVPKTTPITPQHLMATVFHVLGLPQDLHYKDPTGRPVPMVESGRPIAELV